MPEATAPQQKPTSHHLKLAIADAAILLVDSYRASGWRSARTQERMQALMQLADTLAAEQNPAPRPTVG